MSTLNANIGTPLYHQLAEQILLQIQEQIFLPGDKLPSEAILGEKYHVSRVTVRKAVELLVADGILVRQQGKGTFVLPSSPINRMSKKLTSFSATCQRSGKIPSTRVYLREFAPLPRWAEKFFSPSAPSADNTTGIVLERLRYADSIPVILEWSLFPQKFDFLLQADVSGSLHQELYKHGLDPHTCMSVPDVCLATQEEAKLLQVYSGKPLLMIKSYYTDCKNQPLYVSKEIVVSDRFKYSFFSGSEKY